ncbi:hypothetical protein KIN20_018776 [Parelaphostrongylus tenuis]|uniref:Uncharacterized protein n=1 Tax=Parelaphostrongylus tenuis TaxID=148309 RepID=A0AAD5MKH2_PARTN|nr:hypothetical protein KIN20_018776 [Parelaphostrongylus tenuis]
MSYINNNQAPKRREQINIEENELTPRNASKIPTLKTVQEYDFMKEDEHTPFSKKEQFGSTNIPISRFT